MRFFLDTCIYIVAVSSWCLRVFKLGSIIFFNNEDVRDYGTRWKRNGWNRLQSRKIIVTSRHVMKLQRWI